MRARCADGGVTLLAERVQLGPGRWRGLASRCRPRRVLERGLERQLEGRVVAIAVVLVDPRYRAEDRRVEASEFAAGPAHHYRRRVAFERRRQVVRRHKVVELRELFAAAAQLPLEAVDRSEVERALGAGRPVVFWAVGALRGVARRRRRRRRLMVVARRVAQGRAVGRFVAFRVRL